MSNKRNLHNSRNNSLPGGSKRLSTRAHGRPKHARSGDFSLGSTPFEPNTSYNNSTSTRQGMRSNNHAKPRKNARGSYKGTEDTVSVGSLVLTRRQLLYGALGAGALVAVGAGGSVISENMKKENEITILEVPEAAVTASTDLSEVSNNGAISLVAYLKLPYGTLAWASDDDYAALLIPTETGSPLTKVALLRLSSGYSYTVLEAAVGHAHGFEIYDVRANSQAMIWTEVDIMEGVWRIYTATLVDGSISGEPLMVDEGSSEWETPSIAVSGGRCFWQVLPSLSGEKTAEPSLVKSARTGSTDIETVWTSIGRMCTPIYSLDDGIVITPRVDTAGVYHQLTYVSANDLSVKDSLILPASMKPLEAGYGKTGFMFSFEGIYNYGGGIANLGTYAPKQDARGLDHSSVEWFRFARTPSAAPCWCGNLLIVKSTRSICCVDLGENVYALLNAQDASDTYGAYLASTGNRSRIVSFENVIDKHITGGEDRYCYLQVWQA